MPSTTSNSAIRTAERVWAPTRASNEVHSPRHHASGRGGFRADLDALPIAEVSGAKYASRNPGIMHACGHDGHTAALLALARRLAAKPTLSKPLLLVFQQAEEGHPSGAPKVLQGLSPKSLPREFIGFHLWPELPSGVIGLRSGALLPSVAGVTIRIRGTAGRVHGTTFGMDSVDALAIGNQLYTALTSQWVARHPNDLQPASLNIGRFDAGSAPNRVPTMCSLEGTLRALSWAEQETAVNSIREITAKIAPRNCKLEVHIESGIRPPVSNAPASVERIQAACEKLGIGSRIYPEYPIGVSDDFGWYLDSSPGALYFLGCGKGDSTPDLHTPSFDFDESVLLNAVDVGLALVNNLPSYDD